jgi:hypothetical protein
MEVVRTKYQHLLDLWKDAGAGIPIYQQVEILPPDIPAESCDEPLSR